MYHFIINPSSSSGNGIVIWNKVQNKLDESGIAYDYHITSSRADAISYTRQISESSNGDTDNQQLILIVIGGDGTFNAIINGIEDYSKVTIGYIPAGSSNDLARNLNISSDPEIALSTILSPQEYTLMDIGILEYELTSANNNSSLSNKEQSGKVNFSVSCGIGFDAAICLEANKSRLKEILNRFHLGKFVYVMIALKQLAALQKCGCKITLDAKKEIDINRFFFIATMIHKYEGGGFMFCPKADYQDKTLDLCTVSDIAKPKVIRILPTAYKGKHVGFDGINNHTAQRVSIKTELPCALHTDGEVVGLYDKISISLDPRQIRIITH